VGLRTWLTTGVLVVGLALPAGLAQAATPVPPTTTALSLSVSTTRLTHGADLTVSARLTNVDTGAPVPDATVVLERRRAATTSYVVLATLVSDADGVVRFVYKPAFNADYTVRYDGSPTLAPSNAGPKRVDVAPRLTAKLSKTAARIGSQVTLSGSLTPPHGGATVRIERYYDGAWRLVTTRKLSTAGLYSAVLTTPSTVGWKKYRVVRPADRDNLSATTALPRLDNYRLRTYIVRSKGTITASMTTFAASVAATYADPRGWLRGHQRFKRVSSGGNFTVLLAQARYLPTYSSVCSVQYSCRVGRNVIINQDRWRWGSRYFPGPLAQYRQMVVNHETGHWLGNRHAYCGGNGQLAPVMQQQSKGMQGCKPNAWPLAREL
jgi:hypothetical protein